MGKYLDHQNRDRAELFGSVAAIYDQARPRYPDALFDFLLDRPGPTVLDVGCGTGIAARALQARGAQVLGLEIDERMAAIARASGLDVVCTRFETWDGLGRTFDLITCAQAWHWIDPADGTMQAAQLLAAGGRLALFWNYAELTAEQHRRLDPVYAEIAPGLSESVVLSSGSAGLDDHVRDIDRSARFHPVQRHEFKWTHTYTRDEWLTLIGTHSDHLLLPDDVRARLLAAVGAAIDASGPTWPVRYVTSLLLARRL